jgi:hypothetical protein
VSLLDLVGSDKRSMLNLHIERRPGKMRKEQRSITRI